MDKAMATSCTGERTKTDLTQTCYFHRKEVTLQAGSVLKIRGHPRDLVQVWLKISILNFRPGHDEQTILSPCQVMVNYAYQDLGQVMVNGVNVNPPLLTTSALQTTFGSWAVRDAEFTFVDEIEVGERLHSPAKHGIIRDVRSSAPWT